MTSIFPFSRLGLVRGMLLATTLILPCLSSAQDRQTPPNSPLDVQSLLEQNNAPTDPTFSFPQYDAALEPWFDAKLKLAERTGLKLGFDYQFVGQSADNSIGETDALGGFARFFGTWEIFGRGTDRTGSLVFNLQSRHRLGDTISPEALGPNFGYAGITAPDFSEQGLGLTELYWRQQWLGDLPIELRIGRLSAYGYFNVTPASDSNTAFMNSTIILSPTVSYPTAGGLGAAAFVGLPGNLYAVATINDAHGSYDDLGFDNIAKGRFFKGLELGWSNRGVSSDMFRFDNVHIVLWHKDALDEPGSDDVGGVSFAAFQWFDEQRWGAFFRAGKAFGAPLTLNETAVAGGVLGNFYKEDLLGVGLSWGQPWDSDVDQTAAEVFYRWQIAKNIAITPSVQFISNPAFNPEDDQVTVWGIRTRFTF